MRKLVNWLLRLRQSIYSNRGVDSDGVQGWNPWLGASAPTPPVSTVLTVAINPQPVESNEIAIAAKALEKLSPDIMKTTQQEQLVELRQILQQKLAEIEAILAE